MSERATNASGGTEPATRPGPPADDLLRTLAKAADLVDALREEPQYKRALADELGVSKSTVYNWARELTDHGIVERTQEGYALTALGVQVADAFRFTTETTTRLYAAEPALATMPPEAVPPFDLMTTATVVTTDESPTAPLDAFMAWIDDATHVTGLPGLSYPRSFEAVADRLRRGELTCNVVVEADAVGTLVEDYRDVSQQVLAGPSTVHVTEADLPMGLYVLDESTPRVGVTTYTDHGHMSGFMRLRGDAAVSWALDVYEDVRADAVAVDSLAQRDEFDA